MVGIFRPMPAKSHSFVFLHVHLGFCMTFQHIKDVFVLLSQRFVLLQFARKNGLPKPLPTTGYHVYLHEHLSGNKVAIDGTLFSLLK